METKQTQRFTYRLGPYEKVLNAFLSKARQANFLQRLWHYDKHLWTGEDEDKWLGWLDIVGKQMAQIDVFQSIAKEIKDAGFTHCVLLGMGGSSMCAEVFSKTFGRIEGHPQLIVLDSIVPDQIQSVQAGIDLKRTLFIVSSKSGSTVEPNMLLEYFYDRVSAQSKNPGTNFIAITDPGSSLEKQASDFSFRHVFHGVPSVGGRYSALSHFGMIPAAIMGTDVTKILHSAQEIVEGCAPNVMPERNPGLLLGAVMGTMAQEGKDKLTVIISPRIASFSLWIEQLIAESTGKEGRGIVPIADEPLGDLSVYGNDRLFVYVCLQNASDPNQDILVTKLEEAGHPVVRIELDEPNQLGGEFFRWEFATAVAGAIIGINAFNQPNVQESKDYTKNLLKQYVEHNSLPETGLLYEDDGIQLFADENNKGELTQLIKAKSNPSLGDYLQARLARIKEGDYFAITAYIEYEERLKEIIESMRVHVRDKYKVATTFGYGPRFLHSTGQLHKGGPNTGVFLQITSDDRMDLTIPGEQFTFGILKQAQSLGDFQALSAHSRRALRVNIKGNVSTELSRLTQAVCRE